MAQTSRTVSEPGDNDTFLRVFFRGFFAPLRFIWRCLAWVTHRPPLKQIGHGIRWFFRLRAMRFLGRVLGFSFIRSSWQELKMVTWPTWHESRRLTTAVILFSVVFGVLIALVDFGLDKLFKQLILK